MKLGTYIMPLESISTAYSYASSNSLSACLSPTVAR
jgi:hypothetical protein